MQEAFAAKKNARFMTAIGHFTASNSS